MDLILEVIKEVWFVLSVLAGIFLGLIIGISAWIDKKKSNGITNTLSLDEKIRFEEDGWLVLSPPGDTQDFIFSPAKCAYTAGGAYFGMSLDAHKYIDKHKGVVYSHFSGGVIGLEDCTRLRNHLNSHIEEMGKINTPT